jgi:hypothetical protein
MVSSADTTLNLSGQWSGTFSYPDGFGPSTPFEASMEDKDGHLSGNIIERSIVCGTTLEAAFIGSRHGLSCDFTKTYSSNAPPDYDQPVDYVGGIATDGLTITGVWSLLDWDGKFEMHRDRASCKAAIISTDVVEPVSFD